MEKCKEKKNKNQEKNQTRRKKERERNKNRKGKYKTNAQWNKKLEWRTRRSVNWAGPTCLPAGVAFTC